jgi:acyl-CoA thioester hydrolase
MPTEFETARGTIHAWQCDHMGHANLRAYGELFEQALWQVFARIGLTPSALRAGPVHMAGVQQNTSYHQELYPGDCVVVRSRLTDVRARRLTMRHEMVSVETGAVCATCELTAVCIDAATRKPVAFPAEVAGKALAILSPDGPARGEPCE